MTYSEPHWDQIRQHIPGMALKIPGDRRIFLATERISIYNQRFM
jgi:hypothetical protein